MRLSLDHLNPISASDTVIHFAPEPEVSLFVRKITAHYKGADIEPGRADLVINIENISLPDNSVDVVIASHVLEHVDDKKALSELYRILKPRGRIILAVPIAEGWDGTYEDGNIKEPALRDLHFGRFDHIRFYGRDFRDRVEHAGFSIEEYSCSGAVTVRYGLARGERIFIGTKV